MKTMFRFGISLFCAKCGLSRIYKLGFDRSVNECLYTICKSAISGQNSLSPCVCVKGADEEGDEGG
ncbi:hypothetical protein RHGRI_021107 [Rhododendron griersonianum]|uniref:Uncharacterized protein n=1 Tax=Rhododendron griersonianum TaxID=479676 RepID=A0AAV6JKB2_9ERIC|nr:hypothetical protein RHGRI_021107 [Rhododendron griersonianum]